MKQIDILDLGYEIEHRELVAADYGAPTTRKRFVLVARCDGKPIVWPKRTHAPRDSEEVRSGKLLPWRSAAEIIDWSITGYSIFSTKQELWKRYGVKTVRPLANNTLRRVIRGVDKFTIRSGKPFIVPTGYGERQGQQPRVHDLEKPLSTVVSTVKQNLCQPLITPFTFFVSFYNAAKRIKKKTDRADFYDAVCAYAMLNIEPDMDSLPDVVAIAFDLIRPVLDNCKVKAANRSKSSKQSETKSKQSENKTERTVKDKEGERDKEKESDKEMDMDREGRSRGIACVRDRK